MKLQVEQIDQTNKTGIESKREKKGKSDGEIRFQATKGCFTRIHAIPTTMTLTLMVKKKKNRERSEKHANKKSAERYADIKMRNKTGSSVTLYQLCRVEERRYPNIDLTAAEWKKTVHTQNEPGNSQKKFRAVAGLSWWKNPEKFNVNGTFFHVQNVKVSLSLDSSFSCNEEPEKKPRRLWLAHHVQSGGETHYRERTKGMLKLVKHNFHPIFHFPFSTNP